MLNAPMPSLLPVYKRAPVTFERGEGMGAFSMVDITLRGLRPSASGIVTIGNGRNRSQPVDRIAGWSQLSRFLASPYFGSVMQRRPSTMMPSDRSLSATADLAGLCGQGSIGWHHSLFGLRGRMAGA